MAPSLPLILLPPSEGKAPGGDGPCWTGGSMTIDLDERRNKALAALAKAMRGSEGARAKLLGVKGRALEVATNANRAVRTSSTRPALQRYTGVLYDALDHGSLTATQRRRLDASVLIFSGLWGLVVPNDPIPEYKLKMGASLPGLGKLSSWWRRDLSACLAERASGLRVWNLLPNEHAAAWRAPLGLPQWWVRFFERRSDGDLAAVSHDNKSLKGALVRHLLAHPTAEPADLSGWRGPDGAAYDASVSEYRSGLAVVSLVKLN
jgi:cytoplasmic iron level regulating protein YaaA (DUF328/UPF0246 family)